MIVPPLSNEAYWNRMGATKLLPTFDWILSTNLHWREVPDSLLHSFRFPYPSTCTASGFHMISFALNRKSRITWHRTTCIYRPFLTASSFLNPFLVNSRVSPWSHLSEASDLDVFFKVMLEPWRVWDAQVEACGWWRSRGSFYHRFKKSVSHTTFKRGFVSTSQACRMIWCKACHAATCDCKSLLRCPSWSWSYH